MFTSNQSLAKNFPELQANVQEFRPIGALKREVVILIEEMGIEYLLHHKCDGLKPVFA